MLFIDDAFNLLNLFYLTLIWRTFSERSEGKRLGNSCLSLGHNNFRFMVFTMYKKFIYIKIGSCVSEKYMNFYRQSLLQILLRLFNI